MRHQLQTVEGKAPYTVQDGDTTEKLMRTHGVDIFAFEQGYCNGPRCVACGTSKCHHHDPEWWLGECPAPKLAHSSVS